MSPSSLPRKPAVFMGRSLAEMQSLPPSVKDDLGYQLDLVQSGRDPSDWKPLTATVGPGVRELRTAMEGSWFRVAYIAQFPEAVYILAAFKKQTNSTSKRDLDLIRQRLAEVHQYRKNLK